MPKKDPMIYDFAKYCGISISMVSRVLNNPEKVNSETRALVLEAIDKLEFVPRAEARARALSSTDRIMEILRARIADPGRPPQHVNLPLTLIERRTT